MANKIVDKFSRELTSGELDFKSPVSEDVAQEFGREIHKDSKALIVGDTSNTLAGALDSTPGTADPSTITDTDPTAPATGTHARDDQYIGLYVHFTSGTIFSNNSLNAFKITDSDATAKTLTVVEDLAALGATIGDTYVLFGHTHDGAGTDQDGEAIDLKNLVNRAEDDTMTQNIADAITDPDGNRANAATKANPFSTLTDIQGGSAAYESNTGDNGGEWDIDIAHGLGRIPVVVIVEFWFENSDDSIRQIGTVHWTNGESHTFGADWGSGNTDGSNSPTPVHAETSDDSITHEDTVLPTVGVDDQNWMLTVDATNVNLFCDNPEANRSRQFFMKFN